MAAPNLLGTTSVTGKSTFITLSTVTGNILTNASSSNTVDKINTVVLSNYTATTVTANVLINRNSVGYFLAGNVSIPANSTLALVGKDTPIYLEEGDVLQANVSANSSVSMTVSYELMS